MSFFRNPVRRQTLPVQPGLSRLLLLGRFDLWHKAWSLPSPDIYRDPAAGIPGGFPAGSAALVAVISRQHSDFSDPAMGCANPSKAAHRRMTIRRYHRRFLGKTKTTKRKET